MTKIGYGALSLFRRQSFRFVFLKRPLLILNHLTRANKTMTPRDVTGFAFFLLLEIGQFLHVFGTFLKSFFAQLHRKRRQKEKFYWRNQQKTSGQCSKITYFCPLSWSNVSSLIHKHTQLQPRSGSRTCKINIAYHDKLNAPLSRGPVLIWYFSRLGVRLATNTQMTCS